jgi:hypothetical protein
LSWIDDTFTSKLVIPKQIDLPSRLLPDRTTLSLLGFSSIEEIMKHINAKGHVDILKQLGSTH